MDFGKAFSFVFEDEQWVSKVIIGGLLILVSFLIIPWFFVEGYVIELIQRIHSGKEGLPEWTDFGGKLAKGFSIFLIRFLYTLPAFAVFFLSIALFTLIGVLADSNSQALGILILLIGGFLWLLYFVFILVVAFLTPGFTIRYAMTGQISQALQVREVWKFSKENVLNVILVLLLTYVAGLIGSIGLVAFIIGAVFTTFYSLLVVGHMYGQLAKASEVETVSVSEEKE